MQSTNYRASQGVALLAALFVLMMLSIIGIGLLMNVDDDVKLSKSAENSERALKIAEAGVQVARSTFFDPAAIKQNIIGDQELYSIDGFYNGGYFMAQLEAALRGNEKWTQWRYDGSVSGHNTESEISAPVFHVWQTGALGVNGSWSSSAFYINPLYGIVATGTYFSIENATGNTLVRAHDEVTGKREVDSYTGFGANRFWINDKTLTTTFDSLSIAHAVNMSPMATYSNYSSLTDPALIQQTLYFTYAGNNTALTGNDRASTVRLRAVDALCHGGGYGGSNGDNYDAQGEPLKSLWEFDTGIHGVGSAPTVYTIDPDRRGSSEKVIYFIVTERGKSGSPGALDLNAANATEATLYPSHVRQDNEQIYVFAILDLTGRITSCNQTGTYKVKWNTRYPDPDVADWTDYPTEHISGTNGYFPPFARVPADMHPSMPEGDLLADYRDGPGIANAIVVGSPQLTARDNQWNQVRGNVVGNTPAVSPPILNVRWRKSDGTLTTDRNDAADAFDPILDLYVMYAAHTRNTYLRDSNTSSTTNFASPHYYLNVMGYHGAGWGPEGYHKPNTQQTRVLAMRDRLDIRSNVVQYKTAKSRFPEVKWNMPVPPWDPDQTFANPDDRPGHGYGEYTWDTWFTDQIAPMVTNLPWDQDATLATPPTPWANVGGTGAPQGGAENLYTIIYPYYKSSGYPTGGADTNNRANGQRGPSTSVTAEQAPLNFDVANPTLVDNAATNFAPNSWADSRVMMAAFRDTWDDYRAGNQTHIQGTTNLRSTINNREILGMGLSNPVEYFWNHTSNAADPNTVDRNNNPLITYNAGLNAQYAAKATGSKIGFPRPYAWWEALWLQNVRAAAAGSEKGLSGQGWNGVTRNPTTDDLSLDPDVEGETAAMCADCLFQQGLVVLSLNHDLQVGNCNDALGTCTENNDREDLRLHAINATTGTHVWDYHLPASLAGDDANTTPAIANNLVFVAFQQFGGTRRAQLIILDADSGVIRQRPFTIDGTADAVILPPTIANGAVYVGTYDYSGPVGGTGFPTTGNNADDTIRLFAMSPVLRLVSTGIYPFDPPFAKFPYGYKNYTGKNFRNITLLDHDAIFMNVSGQVSDVWKRKLQVWITGQNSKWEEVREVLE